MSIVSRSRSVHSVADTAEYFYGVNEKNQTVAVPAASLSNLTPDNAAKLTLMSASEDGTDAADVYAAAAADTTESGFLQFIRPVRYGDGGSYADRDAIVTIRRDVSGTMPTKIRPAFWITSIGRGDAASVTGASGGFVDVRDSATIVEAERGCLYGLQLTAAPRFPRTVTGFDDVACLIVQHNGSTPGANGTDAIYIGRNDTYFPGNDTEWTTGMTNSANCGYGYRTTGSTFTGYNVGGRMRGEAGTTYGFTADGTIQSSVTDSAFMFRTLPNLIAESFTLANLNHYSAAQGTIGAGSAVTNQYGFRVSSSMVGATNNYGFRSDLAAATDVWGIYTGTAQNYIAGRTIIGTSPTSVANAQSAEGYLQLVGNSGAQTVALIGRYTADANGGALSFAKSRNTTVGSHTLVTDGDALGTLNFEGSDGDQLVRGATIAAQVDGTAANNSMPGRLVFSTTPSGSTSPSVRVTLDRDGNFIQTAPAAAPTLTTARQLVMNLTSDTNLRISVRGSDGTTRVANITLA